MLEQLCGATVLRIGDGKPKTMQLSLTKAWKPPLYVSTEAWGHNKSHNKSYQETVSTGVATRVKAGLAARREGLG
jgi:hypothetical protein